MRVVNRSVFVRLSAWFLLVSAVLTLCACIPTDGPTAEEQRISQVALRPTDFGPLWKRRFPRPDDIDGALVAQTYALENQASTPNLLIGVGHQIILYPNADAAASAYLELEMKWFPNAKWTTPEQLLYESATADQFRLACLPCEINGVPAYSFTAMGQYADIVSGLHGTVYDDRHFTWTDLDHVLTIIDQRMMAQVEPQLHTTVGETTVKGTLPFGILAIVGSLWWFAVNWRLWRDPELLHPKHWRYHAVHRRLRGVVRRPSEGDLGADEIRRHAVGSMVVGIFGVVVGVLLVLGLYG